MSEVRKPKYDRPKPFNMLRTQEEHSTVYSAEMPDNPLEGGALDPNAEGVTNWSRWDKDLKRVVGPTAEPVGLMAKPLDPWDRPVHPPYGKKNEQIREKIEAVLEERKNQVKKETNPKDAVGIKKPGISCVSFGVMSYLGLAMMEGARKYGRHNYRVAGVRPSVYIDAMWRHMSAYYEFSQDTDPDSGLPHLAKAMACLAVLLDAHLMGKVNDDRPPPLPEGLLTEFQQHTNALFDRHPISVDAFTRVGQEAVNPRPVES